MARGKKVQDAPLAEPERLTDIRVAPTTVEWLGELVGPIAVEIPMGGEVSWPTPIENVLRYMAGPVPADALPERTALREKAALWRAADLEEEIAAIDYHPLLTQEAKDRRVAAPRDELAALKPHLPRAHIPDACPAEGEPRRNEWIVARHAARRATGVRDYTSRVAKDAGISEQRVRKIVREAKKKAKPQPATPFGGLAGLPRK